jgi:hypothetical protein
VELHRQAPSCSRRTDATAILTSFEDPYEALLPSIACEITPCGLGVVELGLAGALVLAGGAKAQVAAAVLVFRVLTFLLPIPIGAVTYWLWRRAEGHRQAPTNTRVTA